MCLAEFWNEYMLKELREKTAGRTFLPEYEVKGLLRDMGFSVPKGIFVQIGEAVPENLALNYPLVAKVSSQKIASKSELHGVRTGLQDERELLVAVEEILQIENAEGVLIEEMAPRGVEVIIGGVLDQQFGPVMMFGLGGIFTELFRDVSFCLAPLRQDDAFWMINDIKGRRLFEGYRGNTAVDKDALTKILISVSELMATGFLEEIDLNPVVLYAQGAMVLDAKIKLRLS